eukprot:5445858-Prymnesium_polylepis.1
MRWWWRMKQGGWMGCGCRAGACCGGSRCTSLLFAACLAVRFEALRCRSSDSSTSGDVMHVERAGRVVVSKAWCVAPSTQQGRAASRPCVHRQRRGGVLAMAWKP